MQMYVPFHSRAGSASNVHAQVIALGVIGSLKRSLHFLGKLHHLGKRSRVGSLQISHVCVGNNHYVAGGIRIAIQDNEVFFAAENNVGTSIVVGCDRGAENAAFFFSARGDVLVAPRAPKIIQSVSLSWKIPRAMRTSHDSRSLSIPCSA